MYLDLNTSYKRNMGNNSVLYSVCNGVATITLNKPETMNAFDASMINIVLNFFSTAEENDAVKCIVIEANGKAFSGGGDLQEMLENAEAKKVFIANIVGPVAEISKSFKKSRKPIIASVHGPVVGVAFCIVTACDFCIAADDTKFMLAFANIALVPDGGGVFLLTRAIGTSKVIQMAMLGSSISAEEGKHAGFVYKVCRLEDLENETDKLSKRLTNGPLVAYGNIKELIYESQYKGFEDYIKLECEKQKICEQTDDFKEGLRAFVEKRKPEFSGK